MAEATHPALDRVAPASNRPGALHVGYVLATCVVMASFLAASFIPPGRGLSVFGDTLQVALVLLIAILSFQNVLRSHARTRIFWFLIFIGSGLWGASNAIWAFYEVWLARPVPDLPLVDALLFVKVVPLAAAAAVAPDREHDARFRAFDLIDVSVLMVYSLYLYAFGVYAYRLLPGTANTYNLNFNLADAIGNQILIIVAAVALLRSQESWRRLYRLYFFTAACYGLSSDVINVAIDQNSYYTGSLYDVPLIAALAAFVCVALAGRKNLDRSSGAPACNVAEDSAVPTSFLSSHLAMLVALSIPLMGFWLLASAGVPSPMLHFRVEVTLFTILFVTLLLSVKQDLLTAGLIGSLGRLSETYGTIERYKTHLTQSEKLASLGELVAQVAIQIKACMGAILHAALHLALCPQRQSRVPGLAEKIAKHAQRTDALVDNMLQFAQETPMILAPVDIKTLIESALHLSRVAKQPNVRIEFLEENTCPAVYGDSSRLLHVFLQLISNAVDALAEAGGGSLQIAVRPSASHVVVEFADSGPGIREPSRVFEPFYTTKAVGKGTGLGLSTCYGIIQQHDGEISCRNRPEGGANFTLTLPLAQQTLPERKEPTPALVEGLP
jgi:signal transduction histidine kinase